MPKSTQHAALICLILTLIAAAGAAIGIWKSVPLAVIILMIPAVCYEVYRTEGLFTKIASIGILAILIGEIVLILGNYNINLAQVIPSLGFLNMPLDIQLAGPVIIAFLSLMLLRRTGGIYTKWLAVVIFAASVALFYTLEPTLFRNILNRGPREGSSTINKTVPQGIRQKIEQGIKGLKK